MPGLLTNSARCWVDFAFQLEGWRMAWHRLGWSVRLADGWQCRAVERKTGLNMKLVISLAIAGLVVAGCEQCSPDPNVSVGVGVGSDGVSGGVSVGQSCGPVNFSVGTGDFWHLAF